MAVSAVAPLRLAILGLALGLVGAAPLMLKMLPTTDFDDAAFEGSMYFKVEDPPTQNSSCKSVTVTAGEEQTECGGEITLDLSTQNELTISFQAPDGYEILIDGPERSRVEFQAKVPCGPNDFSAFKHQSITGDGGSFQLNTEGSKTDVLTYNAGSSFVDLGKCDGCDECEVYTRVQFDGPIAGARVTEITWTIQYDQNNTVAGPQAYRYGTDLYCWIRGATLAVVESEPPRRLSDFAGNSFQLIKLGGANADSATKIRRFSPLLLLLAAVLS